jgi:hypothetical protein
MDSTRPHMILGAVAALILDYAAVAAMIALLALDRWPGVSLDLLLILVIAVVVADSVIAWLVGSRFDRGLARNIDARPQACELYSNDKRQVTNSLDN